MCNILGYECSRIFTIMLSQLQSVVKVPQQCESDGALKALVMGYLRCYSMTREEDLGVNPYGILKKMTLVDKNSYLLAILKWLCDGTEFPQRLAKKRVLDCFIPHSKIWRFMNLTFTDMGTNPISLSYDMLSVLARLLKRPLVIATIGGQIVNNRIPLDIVHALPNKQESATLQTCDSTIVLVRQDGIYFLLQKIVESVTGSSTKTHICLSCHDFVHPKRHDCSNLVIPCKACGTTTCNSATLSKPVFNYKCENCGNLFYDLKCYTECHSRSKNWCNNNTFCVVCTKRYIKTSTPHRCGEIKCGSCKAVYLPSEYHCCLMWRKFTKSSWVKLVENNPHRKFPKSGPSWAMIRKPLTKLAFYDFETASPNVNDSQQVVCGYFKAIEYNDGEDHSVEFRTITEFITEILHPSYNGYHFFAHNGASFDVTFVFRELIKISNMPNGLTTPNGIIYVCDNATLVKASKYMRVQVEFSYVPIRNGKKLKPKNKQKIVFRDSYLLFSRSLRDFAKAMGVEIGKGFFPLSLNVLTIDNPDVVIPFPSEDIFKVPRSYYDEFKVWYDEEKAKYPMYPVYERMMAYCVQDVDSLAAATLAYRTQFLTLSNGEIDPLVFNTSASFAQSVYLSMFAPEHSIYPEKTVIPLLNTPRKSKKTVYEIEYTRYIINLKDDHEFLRGKIIHDYQPTVVTMFEGRTYVWILASCYWCGHECHNTVAGKENDWRFKCFENTVNKLKTCCIVDVMWECEWLDCREEHEDMVATPRNGDMFTMDIFKISGGVTEVYNNLYICNEAEEIVCYDVVSEYPSVQKYCPYPIGEIHSVIFDNTGVKDFIQSMHDAVGLLNYPRYMVSPLDVPVKYFGMFHVHLLPPRNLYAPVIAGLWNDKRYYTLCAACSADESEQCTHTDFERTWWATLTTIDIVHAVSKGYRILDVSEGWHSPLSCVNWGKGDYRLKPECFSVFSKYVSELYAIKNHAKKDGNKALEQVAKNLLNSLWGKMGQKLAYSMKEIIFHNDDGDKRYANLRNNPQYTNFENEVFPDFMVTRCENDLSFDKYNTSLFTNHIIANFVTAYGRCKLLSAVNALNDSGYKVLYTDTDSVMFVQPLGNVVELDELPLGKGLGQWESEADKVFNHTVKEFISVGRKMYAWFGYKPDGSRITLKCRAKGCSASSMGETLEALNGEFPANGLTYEMFYSLLNKQDIELYETRFVNQRDLTIFINNEYKKIIKNTVRHRIFRNRVSYPFGYQ